MFNLCVPKVSGRIVAQLPELERNDFTHREEEVPGRGRK